MTENKDMLAQLRKTVQAKLRDTQKDPDLQFVEEGIKQLTPEQMERAKELIDQELRKSVSSENKERPRPGILRKKHSESPKERSRKRRRHRKDHAAPSHKSSAAECEKQQEELRKKIDDIKKTEVKKTEAKKDFTTGTSSHYSTEDDSED